MGIKARKLEMDFVIEGDEKSTHPQRRLTRLDVRDTLCEPRRGPDRKEHPLKAPLHWVDGIAFWPVENVNDATEQADGEDD